MNILIIGFGNIGKAHLAGIIKLKKKIKVYVFDKKKIYNKFSDNRVEKINKIPSNFNFDLVIISTDVKVRLAIIKKLIKNKNNIKYLLLEKYLFKNINEFVEFEKKYLKKIQKDCLVNCWGDILLKSLKIKNKKKVNKISIKIDKSSYLTSLIHFLQILKNFKKINNNFKTYLNIKKIINSKRQNYKELEGKIEIYKKDFCFVYQSAKQKVAFKLNLYFKKSILSVKLLNNLKIKITNNRKNRLIDFPLTSHTSEKLVKSIFYKKNIELPRYKDISPLNKFIITILKNKLTPEKFT